MAIRAIRKRKAVQRHPNGNKKAFLGHLAPRPHPLSSVAADAHLLVDRALAQGRNYLYVDGQGRIRDVRHDADVSALPPKPPASPAREAQVETATPPATPVPPTVLDELREIISKTSRLVMVLGG